MVAALAGSVSFPFWAANLLGMVVLFVPALWLFLRTIAPVEEQLEERKLFLACGGGTIFGTIAEALILVGGFDLRSPEVGYASLMFVTPALELLLLWLGLAATVLLGGMALWLLPALQRDSGVRTAARLALLYLALGFLRISAIERPEPAIDAATALAFAAAAAATYQRGVAALDLPKTVGGLNECARR